MGCRAQRSFSTDHEQQQIRQRALPMAAHTASQRPTQYAAAHDDNSMQQKSSCSPQRRANWDTRKGSGPPASGGAHQPPPGSRAVSAYSSSSHTQQADFTQSTLNLVTCVLGAGALGYPFCFKECGLLLATIIMFVTLVATRISYQLLLYCAQLSGRKSYEGIAEHALGKTGRQVVEFCIAATNLGALVAFLDILADVLSSVAGTIIPPGAEPSRHAYIAGVTLVGALPISLFVREPSLIANMSNAAVVFVIVFALVVFCTAFGPSAAAALGVRWAALTHDSRAAAAAAAVQPPVLHMWNPQGVLVSLPVMAYGFTAHQYYMGIYSMLRAPTVHKMKSVTDMALLVCAAVYWTVGVGGYATFGDRTAGDIIRNFGGQRAVGFWGAYERALKLCYGMAVLGNIPLVILPFSSILAPLLPGDEKIKLQTSTLTSVCTVAGAKRATAAALKGCGTTSSSSSSLHVYKARCSGAGGGGSSKQHVGDNSRCAGGGAVQLDAEALLFEAPAWQQSSKDSFGGNGSSTQRLQWQPPPPLQQQQQAQQQHQQQQCDACEGQPLLPGERVASPEEAPQHPHLTKDACRAAHLLTGPQHTLVVVLVLGLGLASAVWLPNVELIFGLTGSTASVVAAFIMPAICFLRLYEMAPELGSGKRGGGSSGSGGSSSSSLWRMLKQVVFCCCGAGGLLSRGRSRARGSSSRSGRHSSPGASKRAAYSSNGLWGGQQGAQGNSDQGHAGSKVWGPVLVVPELRAQWACRQRLAFVLLAFGVISGLLCTDAILSSISEEKAVVQLAQELVAHEAVVAETSRAQQKAKEAAAAVDAVSTAAQQLGAVDTTTNQTLGSLAAAAAALNTITAVKDSAPSSKGHGGVERQQHPRMWDLKGRIEQHKQKIAEDSVLRNVEAALSTASADIAATSASVTALIIKLDTSIAQIKADAASAAATSAPAAVGQDKGSSSSSSSKAEPGTASSGPAAAAAAAAGGAVSVKAPDGTVVILPSVNTAGSSPIIPHGGDAVPSTATDGQLQKPPAATPDAAGDSSKGSSSSSASSSTGTRSSSGTEAYARANEMARELGKALGSFGQGSAGANLTLTAGRSLEQVRDSAVSALTALNVTSNVLRQVRVAVGAARNMQGQRDSQVKELAVQAMQRAMNATAASALAMRITREALGTAATEETSELLTALTRVAQDLEKSETAAAGGRKRATITVTSDDGSGSAAAKGPPAAAGAAGGGSTSSSASSLSSFGAAGSEAGAASGAGAQGSSSGSAAASTTAGAGGSATTPTSGLSSSSSGSDSSAGGAPAVQATAQPLAKHPTLAEHEAAAAAAANAKAHAESESNTQAQQQGQQATHSTAAAAAAAATASQLRPAEATAADSAGPVPTAAAAKPTVQQQSSGTDASSTAAAAAAANAAAHADTALAATAEEQHAAAAVHPSDAVHSRPAATDGSSSRQSSGSGVQGAAVQATSGAAAVAQLGSTEQAASSDSNKPVLTASEANKIKDIIKHLAAAMSSGSSSSNTATTATTTTSSSSSGSTAAAGGSTGSSSSSSSSHGAASANITQLAAAIQDAVAWTQQSKSAVMGLIVKDLGQTDPKVVQRVMSIVQEVGTTTTSSSSSGSTTSSSEGNGAGQGGGGDDHKGAAAAAAAAVDAAAAAANENGARKAQLPLTQQQQQHDAEGADAAAANSGGHEVRQQQQQVAGQAAAAAARVATAGDAAAVAGPVVTVTSDGVLQQQGGSSGTEGPVVAAASASTSSVPHEGGSGGGGASLIAGATQADGHAADTAVGGAGRGSSAGRAYATATGPGRGEHGASATSAAVVYGSSGTASGSGDNAAASADQGVVYPVLPDMV